MKMQRRLKWITAAEEDQSSTTDSKDIIQRSLEDATVPDTVFRCVKITAQVLGAYSLGDVTTGIQ